MFGGVYNEEAGFGPGGESLPRYHFDYFAPAMITSFILMTGGWYDATVYAMGATSPVAAFFFIFVIVVGCYLILNLFVAILLEAFAGGDEEEGDGDGAHNGGGGGEGVDGGGDSAAAEGSGGGGTDASPTRDAFREKGGGTAKLTATRKTMRKVLKLAADLTVDDPNDRALGCLRRHNPLRHFCHSLVFHPRTDSLIILVILVSSICLAMDSPRLEPDSPLKLFLLQVTVVAVATAVTGVTASASVSASAAVSA